MKINCRANRHFCGKRPRTQTFEFKFESLGTRSFATEMAIGTAIDFHNIIGGKRKEARLRFLKDYWYEKAIKLPKSKFCTSLKPQYSCGIANIGFEGWQAQQIE